MDAEQPTNGFDADELATVVRRIERLQDEIDGILAHAKEECDPVREDIAHVKREAHDKGIGRKELAAVLRKRNHERKAEHAGDSLDLAQRANYAAYLESLERLAVQVGPLGEAALERAQAQA